MDRRESIKTLFFGSLGASLVLNGCNLTAEERKRLDDIYDFSSYGRTEEEKARDKELFAERLLDNHEYDTIVALSGLILPPTSTAGGALDAEVPAFIDFIVKDITSLQDPVRNGIRWLDDYSGDTFAADYLDLTEDQQKAILDEIAYPGDEDDPLEEGRRFFRIIRNLTLTGYYTTEMGYEDLGYMGNRPNIWDGVPEDVLKEHGLEYEEEWLAKCVDQSKRDVVAEWDEDGNLIS